MKKLLFCLTLVILLALAVSVNGEENKDWDSAPVITVAYEMSAEKIYLEWEGNSLLYQVQMDGKKVMDVGQAKAIIPVKKGTHTILVYPTNSDRADKKTISANIDGVGSIGIDLSSLGIGGQDLTFGEASEPLHIDYNPNPILNAVPDKLSATTVAENNVQLSFVDRYNSDEYLITVKSGNDSNYVNFNAYDDSAVFMNHEKAFSSVVLDSNYLASKNCMIPEMNENYSFQVQLRKYAVNLVNNERITTVMLESKPSSWYSYTPIAAWKSAPLVTFASQTADGQVKISWDHEDYGVGVGYSIVRINKALFVKTGEEPIGETEEHEYVISDLTNGGYTFAVFPTYQGEDGPKSEEINIDVKNEWVTAPSIVCELAENNRIRISWTALENIETYHLTVFVGDSNSLLRFVDMDYKKLTEEDITSVAGPMEYTYTYDGTMDNDAEIRLKFELYGIRHTQSGDEQKSAASSATIVLK